MADWMERARQAFAMIAEGRNAVASIVDSVKDGSAAISSDDQAELDRMLEAEREESRRASQNLTDAIAEFRAKRAGGG